MQQKCSFFSFSVILYFHFFLSEKLQYFSPFLIFKKNSCYFFFWKCLSSFFSHSNETSKVLILSKFFLSASNFFFCLRDFCSCFSFSLKVELFCFIFWCNVGLDFHLKKFFDFTLLFKFRDELGSEKQYPNFP